MTTMLHIKIDKKIKQQAEKFAKNNGLTITALVNLSLRGVLNNGGLMIGEPEIPNAKTAKILRQAIKDSKAGKGLSPVFDNMEDAIKYLRNNRK